MNAFSHLQSCRLSLPMVLRDDVANQLPSSDPSILPPAQATPPPEPLSAVQDERALCCSGKWHSWPLCVCPQLAAIAPAVRKRMDDAAAFGEGFVVVTYLGLEFPQCVG